jgi:thioredoxin-related protein
MESLQYISVYYHSTTLKEIAMIKNSLANALLISALISIVSLFCFAGDTSNQKVLIIFSADWCAYCQKVKDDINHDPEISEIIKDYEVIIVDFDRDKELVEGYGVKSLPTIIKKYQGKTFTKVGYKNKRDLKNFLK